MPQTTQSETPENTKNIVTILLLIFAFPIGVVVMWFWPKWSAIVKALVTGVGCLFMLAFLGIVAAVLLVAINPARQVRIADCTKQCQEVSADQRSSCVNACVDSAQTLPPYGE